MQSSWLHRLHVERPTALAVLRGKAKLTDLWAYYQQLEALAFAVHSNSAVLCLVETCMGAHEERTIRTDGIADYPPSATAALEKEERDACKREIELADLLKQSGLHVVASIAQGSEDAWAVSHGASRIAELYEDRRMQSIAAAFACIAPATCAIEARLLPGRGATLHTTRTCRAGEVLLTVPLARCITSADAPPAANVLPPHDTFGRLLLALLHLTGVDYGQVGMLKNALGMPEKVRTEEVAEVVVAAESANVEQAVEVAEAAEVAGDVEVADAVAVAGDKGAPADATLTGASIAHRWDRESTRGAHATIAESDEYAEVLASYWQDLYGLKEAHATMMVLWDDNSAAARRAAHSFVWRRSQRSRLEMIDEHRALQDAGALRCTVEHFMWAKLVLQTRAFATTDGMGLFPLIDLANHLSMGATARVRHLDDASREGHEAACVALVAEYTLDAGDEVCLCYDPNADHLDVLERYGFFDSSSVVHTVEVTVTPELLWGRWAYAECEHAGNASNNDIKRDGNAFNCADSSVGDNHGWPGEEWCEQLVAAQAVCGCDADLQAWWVPDVGIESCPLYMAIRATLVHHEELSETDGEAAERLRRPIIREATARNRLILILESHLAGYACTAEQATRDLSSGSLAPDEETATRLVLFEQTLLTAHLRGLRCGEPES